MNHGGYLLDGNIQLSMPAFLVTFPYLLILWNQEIPLSKLLINPIVKYIFYSFSLNKIQFRFLH